MKCLYFKAGISITKALIRGRNFQIAVRSLNSFRANFISKLKASVIGDKYPFQPLWDIAVDLIFDVLLNLCFPRVLSFVKETKHISFFAADSITFLHGVLDLELLQFIGVTNNSSGLSLDPFISLNLVMSRSFESGIWCHVGVAVSTVQYNVGSHTIDTSTPLWMKWPKPPAKRIRGLRTKHIFESNTS